MLRNEFIWVQKCKYECEYVWNSNFEYIFQLSFKSINHTNIKMESGIWKKEALHYNEKSTFLGRKLTFSYSQKNEIHWQKNSTFTSGIAFTSTNRLRLRHLEGVVLCISCASQSRMMFMNYSMNTCTQFACKPNRLSIQF